MTTDEMRIAVAESVGCEWAVLNGCANDGTRYLVPAGDISEYGFIRAATGKEPICDDPCRNVPNFPADLNAMHEVEVWAIANVPEFDSRYWITLASVTKCSRIDGKQIGHATAAERCEAYLRVKGLWK